MTAAAPPWLEQEGSAEVGGVSVTAAGGKEPQQSRMEITVHTTTHTPLPPPHRPHCNCCFLEVSSLSAHSSAAAEGGLGLRLR